MDIESGNTSHEDRLAKASKAAHLAEANGDDIAAIAAWREYRLIQDAGRPADELLAEGIALSKQAEQLIEPR